MEKVVVAMSGGIDSSYSALWLKSRGFQVIGVSFILYPGQSGIERAKEVAKALKIPHFTLPLEEAFKNLVIKPFLEGYRSGLTPNPCAFCNREIKFGLAMDLALKETRANYYATGHYAKLDTFQGFPLLKIPKNLKKDQTYFLALINSDKLPHLIFPLGEVEEKEKAKEALAQAGLKHWEETPESQEVCFFQGKTLREYLSQFFPKKKGEILYQGRSIGWHEGYYFYTLGQRKGLQVRAGKPLYVKKISSEENRIYLGEKEELFQDTLYLKELNTHLPLELWQNLLVQIRYRTEKIKVQEIAKINVGFEVKLEKMAFAITPGQVCAFYQGEFLVGGAIITS